MSNATNNNPGRRSPGVVPRLPSMPWEAARRPLFEFIVRLLEGWSGIPGGFFDTAPQNVKVQTADGGTEASGWAAADHLHNVSVVAPTGLANANTEGTSVSLNRADHQHKRDIRVAKAGVDVGTRNRANYADTASLTWTIADDGANDEIDISANVVAGAVTPSWSRIFLTMGG